SGKHRRRAEPESLSRVDAHADRGHGRRPEKQGIRGEIHGSAQEPDLLAEEVPQAKPHAAAFAGEDQREANGMVDERDHPREGYDRHIVPEREAPAEHEITHEEKEGRARDQGEPERDVAAYGGDVRGGGAVEEA